MEERIINTGLKGKVAEEIMASVFGQLSDGWGENDSRNNGYWLFGKIDQLDGEVVILIDNARAKMLGGKFVPNKLFSMSDEEVKLWMARLIKKTAKMELADEHDNVGWNRSNNFQLEYLGYKSNPTVSDAYFVYDVLNGRKVEKWPYEWMSTVAAENVKA